MTPEELEIFRRAVEAGAYEDLRAAWYNVTPEEGSAPIHSPEDTRIIRELVERASSLVGRDLVADQALFDNVGQAFRGRKYAFGSAMSDTTTHFMYCRYHDEGWNE